MGCSPVDVIRGCEHFLKTVTQPFYHESSVNGGKNFFEEGFIADAAIGTIDHKCHVIAIVPSVEMHLLIFWE